MLESTDRCCGFTAHRVIISTIEAANSVKGCQRAGLCILGGVQPKGWCDDILDREKAIENEKAVRHSPKQPFNQCRLPSERKIPQMLANKKVHSQQRLLLGDV